MILLWALFGLLTAMAIGRIEKSNKLFWILFTSFMVGIAGGHLYMKYKEAKSEESVPVIMPTVGQTTPVFVTADVVTELCAPAPKLLSKVYYGTSTPSITLSKACSSLNTPPPESNDPLGIC